MAKASKLKTSPISRMIEGQTKEVTFTEVK